MCVRAQPASGFVGSLRETFGRVRRRKIDRGVFRMWVRAQPAFLLPFQVGFDYNGISMIPYLSNGFQPQRQEDKAMARIIVNTARSKGTINRNIYGHFAEHLGRCIYGGLYAGENSDIPNVNGMRADVVQALKNIAIPVLRWPGGCFADTYHWMDGIGPKQERKTIVNTHWGGVTEDNSFGTHEFMELCRQLGCDAYISGNVGSGTVQELSDWIEYCNMGGISPMSALRRKNGQDEPWNIPYWGLGNEAWGCGGNMRAQYYADECRKFATYMRSYAPGQKMVRIACGANTADYHWTKTVVENARDQIDAISLHYYTVPGTWEDKNAATEFTSGDYYQTLARTLFMDELIENHSRIIRQYARGKKIGLVVDEWGTWFKVEPGTNPGFLYQQNTMRDALVASLNLNIFNNHCDSVIMANIAQTVNVLQSMILTEGARMVLTPTYHVFEMYKGHQDAQQLECYAQTAMIGEGGESVPQLHASASRAADGSILVTIANTSLTDDCPIQCFIDVPQTAKATARVLCGDAHAHNTFDAPDTVAPAALEVLLENGELRAALPPCSVAAFTIR